VEDPWRVKWLNKWPITVRAALVGSVAAAALVSAKVVMGVKAVMFIKKSTGRSVRHQVA
jgi:hypothetical protein